MMSTEDEDQIVKLYGAGFSTRQIGLAVHWCQNAVLGALRRRGVEIRPRGGNHQIIKWSEIEQVKFLHDIMGYSQSDIARILGHSNDWVNRRIHKGGIQARPFGWQGQLLIKRKLKEAA